MKKISELISMPLISLFEGEYLGIIHNIVFDSKLKKCTCIIILNENENIKQTITMADIYKIGNNCVFIKNKSCLELESNCLQQFNLLSNPINLSTYNIDGDYLGICKDIFINENYETIKIILNTEIEIDASNIFNFGKNTLIVDTKKTSKNKFRPHIKTIKFDEKESKVIILSKIIEEKNKNGSNTVINPKIITDYRFLVGRILNKDIKAINGEMIAKKDSIVTKDIINKASLYGKLIEISRYSNKK